MCWRKLIFSTLLTDRYGDDRRVICCLFFICIFSLKSNNKGLFYLLLLFFLVFIQHFKENTGMQPYVKTRRRGTRRTQRQRQNWATQVNHTSAAAWGHRHEDEDKDDKQIRPRQSIIPLLPPGEFTTRSRTRQ